MAVRARLEPLAWESEFFQRASARLRFDAAAPPLRPEELDGYAIAQAKIAADDLALADALGQLGFRLAEGEIDLNLTVTPEQPDAAMRPAQLADIPALRAAAAQRFALSRFRAPWYAPQDSGRFYAQWVENAVRGAFDHACLIALTADGQPAGWVTLRQLTPREARIGLLAAWPGRDGQGAGERLLRAARRWCCQQGVEQLRVATQTGNLAALRLYLRHGARVESTAYWLYR